MRRLGFVLLLLFATAGVAQERKPKGSDDPSKGAKNYEFVRGPGGKKVYKIKTDFVIEGKVPKPSVIYVLNASTINYEWENLKKEFLPKVLQSVEQSPF